MPPEAPTRPRARPAVGPGIAAAGATLAGVLIWAVGVPGAGVLADLARALRAEPGALAGALLVPPGVLVRTLMAALGIGILASALGWGPARVLASPTGRRWAPVLAAPMLVPMYLASSAWGQWRDPNTPVGDWLARLAADGHRWAPVLAGKAIAVVGLALWAAPVAACVLAVSMARHDAALDDARRLEGGGVVGRLRHALGAHRGAVAAAIGAVALVMLGSAVPLHLAQMDTAAIVAWRRLSESGPGDWWRAWAGSWPGVAAAVAAGWFVGGWCVREAARVRETGAPPAERRARARWWFIPAGLVLALGVLAPLAMYANAAGSLATYRAFFQIEGAALGSSAATAGAVGLAVALLGACTSALLSTGDARARVVVSIGARVALVAGLVPGVLIGAAVARSPIGGAWALAAAQVARFAFVGIAAGCWAAAGEPPERRALRRLDARPNLGAWARACLPGQWGAIAGAGLAGAALSLHEIEASVIVQPAGVPSLSLDILQMLHYARTQELGAAASVVVAIGLALAWLAGWALARGREHA